MNILYAISTKSDLERKTFCVKIAVDLFVRSWVEIGWCLLLHSLLLVDLFVRSWVEIRLRPLLVISIFMSTSSWGRELKYARRGQKRTETGSTSSWGRELKCTRQVLTCKPLWVDLFVRSWVEILLMEPWPFPSWRSTSSWGRELKYQYQPWRNLGRTVDLFVRSWVEMIIPTAPWTQWPSTSSWGRELKFRFSKICDGLLDVDLFVRSWVEISVLLCLQVVANCRPLREVVSWNLRKSLVFSNRLRRPLREVVSWNNSA